jgi:hypothetical protein
MILRGYEHAHGYSSSATPHGGLAKKSWGKFSPFVEKALFDTTFWLHFSLVTIPSFGVGWLYFSLLPFNVINETVDGYGGANTERRYGCLFLGKMDNILIPQKQ